MSEKVIVVKNQEGCFTQTLNLGCAFVFAIVGLLVLGSCWVMHKATEDAPERPSGASVRSYAKSSTLTAPPSEIVSMMLRKSLRDYMNDPSSYQPGNTRIGDHPDGFAYVHEYRGKNAFGATIKDMCGMLCKTNTGKYAWTFYDRDQLPELLRDVTINGKPIAQLACEGTSTPSSQKPTDDTPQPSAKPASAAQPSAQPVREIRETTCSACSGRGTIPVTVRCAKCGGAGRIYMSGKWQSCPKTRTNGTKSCPTCNGSGKTKSM